MHIKVCVDCGEEYRPEIAVCADCGGQLEVRSGDEAPVASRAAAEAPEGSSDEDFTETIEVAQHIGDLRALADRLVEAGIDFVLRPATPAGFRLRVAAEDRERALGTLGLLADGGAPGEGRACPACETALPSDAAECPECGLTVAGEADPED